MKDKIIECIKIFVLAISFTLLITFLIKPTIVKNYSMSPTLEENDFVIINRQIYNKKPQKGEIVVFKSPLKTPDGKEKLLIKRIIAVPGDALKIEAGKVFINGKLVLEDYLKETYTRGNIDLIIPKGKIFVMGDNRGNSLDSRDGLLGLIDSSDIIGKAFVRLYPFERLGLIN